MFTIIIVIIIIIIIININNSQICSESDNRGIRYLPLQMISWPYSASITEQQSLITQIAQNRKPVVIQGFSMMDNVPTPPAGVCCAAQKSIACEAKTLNMSFWASTSLGRKYDPNLFIT